MTIKEVYIARHGYRWNWLPLPHPPNPTGIDSDPPLAPHGVEQAKELGKYIASFPESEQPQFILSSPFYRCVETSAPVSQELNIPIVLERGVGEWYKVGRGVIPEPANYDTLSKFFTHLSNAEEWDRDSTVGVVPSLRGETEEDIFARTTEFWSKFFPVFEAKYPHIERILIITHAATKIALGMSLLKFSSVFDYLDDNKTILGAGACSLDKYVLSGSKWELKMNGNCDFLSQGEEMNWNFHYGFEAGSDEDIKARKLAAEREGKNEEMEDFYITVDIPHYGEDSETIKPSSKLQTTNLIEPNPLIKLSNKQTEEMLLSNLNTINDRIYQTKWCKLVGNDLIFDEEGELVSKNNEHLSWSSNIKFVEKKEANDEKRVKADGTENKTSFYTQVIQKIQKESNGAPDRLT